MPLVIRELVIRASVGEEEQTTAPAEPPSPPEQEEIVALCVDQVLEILRRREER